MAEATVWFGIGAGIFLTAVVAFLWFAVTRGDLQSPFYYLPPIHAGIAGVAYVAMALVAAGRVGDPVSISALRFGDWLFSTPIITYYLARLAGVEKTTRALAVAANVGMIAVGFAFVETTGALRWVAFGASTLLFVGLLYLFVSTFGTAISRADETVRSVFLSLRDLTIVTWSLYPVVYFVGPLGLGVIQPADLDFLVAILDVVAKVGFMTVLVVRYYELETFVGHEATPFVG